MVDFPTTFQNVFDTPCTKINDEPFMHYVSENWKNTVIFESIPNGNTFENCDDYMKLLLLNCEFDICYDFAKTQHISESENFVAVSSYYWEFWRFLGSNTSTVSVQKANSEIKRICNTPSITNVTDCFEVSYIYNILTTAYGIQASIFKIQFCSHYNFLITGRSIWSY